MASQTIDAFLDRVPYPIPKGLIVIGMSGGVNSSVTAALLKAKGCDEESVVRAAPSASGSVTLAVLIFCSFWLGMCPNGLLEPFSASTFSVVQQPLP